MDPMSILVSAHGAQCLSRWPGTKVAQASGQSCRPQGSSLGEGSSTCHWTCTPLGSHAQPPHVAILKADAVTSPTLQRLQGARPLVRSCAWCTHGSHGVPGPHCSSPAQGHGVWHRVLGLTLLFIS